MKKRLCIIGLLLSLSAASVVYGQDMSDEQADGADAVSAEQTEDLFTVNEIYLRPYNNIEGGDKEIAASITNTSGEFQKQVEVEFTICVRKDSGYDMRSEEIIVSDLEAGETKTSEFSRCNYTYADIDKLEYIQPYRYSTLADDGGIPMIDIRQCFENPRKYVLTDTTTENDVNTYVYTPSEEEE